MATPGGQFALLRQRRFGPFFLAQFAGAFNDNVFKNALMILVAFQGARLSAMPPDLVVNLAGALLVLPFFLFSATAGQLADKYDKGDIARWVKVAEILIALLGGAGFVLESLPLLLAALFLFGIHSAFFGPVKYSILPQHLRGEELVGGNGLVEMGTFLAILLGTVLGGVLVAMPAGPRLLVPLAVLAIAVAGWLAARAIPASPGGDPGLRVSWNLPRQTWRNLRFARQDRTVFLALLGVSWFWFYGALLLSQFPNYGRNVLGGAESVVTLLLATLSVGIGVGSLLCERLSARMVEVGLVPLGALGMTVFGIDLALASPAQAPGHLLEAAAFLRTPGSVRLLADLGLVGLSSGIYIVPLYALVQLRADPAHQSRIIAANNILNALFMVGAFVFSGVLLGSGSGIPRLYLVAALLQGAVTVCVCLLPQCLGRCLAWLLVHSAVRLHRAGTGHVPAHGAALLVCHPASRVDALLLLAASPRPIRMVLPADAPETGLQAWVLRRMGAIRAASGTAAAAGADAVQAALAAGELVALFPGRAQGEAGEAAPFDATLMRLLATGTVPVVPVALLGLEDTRFGRGGSAALAGGSRALRAPVRLVAAAPVLPGEGAAATLHARLLALG